MRFYSKFCFFGILAACWAIAPLARAQTMMRSQPPEAAGPVGPANAARAAAVPNAGAARAVAAPNAGAASAETSGNSLYQVAPDDVVEIHVFQEDDLLTTARVAQDGSINFPLIGSVRIGGKTSDEAARAVATELAKDYLVNPQVTVKVVEYASRRFTVLGQVGKPGTYEMPDRNSITLLEAIGDAGGFTRIANLADIRLKRLVNGKETLYKVSAKGSTTSRETSMFEIKPGDIITVGESFF